MDWLKVLGSPSLLDKDWYKDIEAPALIESDYKGKVCRPTITSVLAYECVNCSRPVFTSYYGKETSLGEFTAGVEEEFFIFYRSCGVTISTESVSFNDNRFNVVTCQCEAELGYFILQLREEYAERKRDTFWVRCQRVRARDSSREMKLMEFVNNKARSVLSQLQKKRLSSGELKSILTPEFIAMAGSAAVDVANLVISGSDANGNVQAPLVLDPEERDCRMLKESEKNPKRAKGYEDDEYSLPPLMEDMLFEEILPRLSVKSLIRYKCVSKKWLHRISDDYFTQNHLCRQSQTIKLSISYLQTIITGVSRLFLLDGQNNNEALVRGVSMYTERFTGAFHRHQVVGSCNGLVCLRVRYVRCGPDPLVVHQNQSEGLVLWNPETGEGREIVAPPLEPGFYRSLIPNQRYRSVADHPVYGLGFDADRNDYKVVRVVPTEPKRLDFDVFSRNSGSWRKFEKGLFGYTVCIESSDSVLLHGRLYWLVLAVESSNAKRRCILSFDLRDEEFRIIDVLEHRAYFYFEADSLQHHHRLVKWEHNFLAYVYQLPGQGKGLRVELVLDSSGNVVVDQKKALLSYRFFESDWNFCGVSHGRFFVACTSKYLMSGSFSVNLDCENDGLKQVLTAWCRGHGCVVRDYVPSLVSAYPDRQTMREEKKKMEAKYWADVFWKMVGLNKEQFGLATIECF